MDFKFKDIRSEHDIISDKVYAAMETGNSGQARTVLADYQESFPAETQSIRSDVQRDYGIRL